MELGKTISHYEILEKLGEGGMGVVYKARDTKLDRTVALKFLPPHLTKSKKDRKRFIREAKSAAALNHPNICGIHAIEEHEGKYFISMEYIEGQTLREKLESGHITFESALEYAIQIAEALGRAHDKGIIHRDIKPGNIMIDANNHIKMMDFGLAKMADSAPITKTGATVGTMAYMAPEQIEGKQIDHRADLFSFGVVLFEMLTGERPFQGQYDAALSYAIVNEEPTPIQDYFQNPPQKLVEFFDRILAKDPDERIESVAIGRNLLEKIKESSAKNLQRTQERVAENISKNQETESGSTTISITLPNFGLGNMSVGRTGLFAGVIGTLAIILLVGWWLLGENTLDTNTESVANVNTAEITDRSIAVLPFNNLSGTDEITSITRGIHDDLLTRLSNIGDLRVTSRTSVGHYRNTDLPIPIIADSLGVRWIMVGGVQQGGDQIQVNAQLIDPQTDANVWADSYRRKLTAENLFAIQEDITGEIADALQAELSAGEQKRIAEAPTRDLNAYQIYVQGRNRLDQLTSMVDVEQAGNLFVQAIEIDSTFALAWAGLADAMAISIGNKTYQPDTLHYQNICHEEAARKALELDPNLSEAHSSMGIIHVYNNDGPAALQAFRKAVELKPSNAHAHNRLGRTYFVLGRPDEGMRHVQLAEELNPQHWHARHALYDAYIIDDQYEKALEEVRQQEKMAPGWLSYNYAKFRTLYLLGEYQKAKEIGLKADSLIAQPRDSIDYAPMMQAYIAEAETALGDTASAKQRVERILSDNSFWRPIDLVYAYCALGDTEAAIQEFQKIENWEWIEVLTLRYQNYPDEMVQIRQDPRYEDLIREVNEYWGLNPDGSFPEDIEQATSL